MGFVKELLVFATMLVILGTIVAVDKGLTDVRTALNFGTVVVGVCAFVIALMFINGMRANKR